MEEPSEQKNEAAKQEFKPDSEQLPHPGRAFAWLFAFLLTMLVSVFVYAIYYGFFIGLTLGQVNSDEVNALFQEHIATINGLAGAGLVQYVMLIPVVIFAANFSKQSWRETLALHPIPLRTFGIWTGVWIIFLLLSSLFEVFFDVPVDDFLLQMNGSKHLLWSFVVVCLAPVAEEFIFRGYLFKAWRKTGLGFIGTLFLTSALFTVIHMGQYGWVALVQVFALAILLGFAREKTGSIITPIFLHFLQNLLSTIVITYLGLA